MALNKKTKNEKGNSSLPSFSRLSHQPSEVAILTYICQDFVLTDEEFMMNDIVIENKNRPAFWIEMAARVNMILGGKLATQAIKEHRDSDSVLDYIMSFDKRMDLNDMLIDAIESYLNTEEEE